MTTKSDVPPFRPYLPNPSVFEADEDLRTWLFTKIINGERAAFRARTFLRKTRQVDRGLEVLHVPEASGEALDRHDLTVEPFGDACGDPVLAVGQDVVFMGLEALGHLAYRGQL